MVWSDCGYNAGETLVLLPGSTVQSKEQTSSESSIVACELIGLQDDVSTLFRVHWHEECPETDH